MIFYTAPSLSQEKILCMLTVLFGVLGSAEIESKIGCLPILTEVVSDENSGRTERGVVNA